MHNSAPDNTKETTMSIHTPRADAVAFSEGDSGKRRDEVVRADVARQLERELTIAVNLLKRIRQWDMLDATEDGAYWKSEIDMVIEG
jgi:3-methyladenine DNA glycosylase AlkD